MTKPNIDPETGIAFGVIPAAKLPELYDDITDKGENDTLNDAIADAVDGIVRACDNFVPHCGLDGLRDAAADFITDNCTFEIDDGDCHWTWEDHEGTVYETDVRIGGSAHIWVRKSRWVTETRPCSPCCPNAGDLGSPVDEGEGFTCYCPPPGYYVEASCLDIVPLVVYKMTRDGRVSERGKQRLREQLVKEGMFE